MRVLLDTNVILDSMLGRAPWHVEADAILRAASEGLVTCASTPLSLATAFYVGRRIVGIEQARLGIRDFIQAFEILLMDRQTMEKADALQGRAFEDNMQMAAAAQSSVDAIVTRDPADFTPSIVRVLGPAQLLQELRDESESRPQ